MLMSSGGGEIDVYSTLTNCLSADVKLRNSAEANISTLATSSENFPVYLVNIAVSERAAFEQRQLAGLSLKNYIDTNWSSSSSKFVGPEPSHEIKEIVRNALLVGLSDPIKKIRVSLAYVISKIAHLDWPEQFPNLLGTLISLLQTKQPISVHGAMRVLIEFVGNDLTEIQLPTVAPVMIPELYNIFSNPSVYEPSVRARSAAILNELVKTFYSVKETHPEVEREYIEPIFNTWLPIFKTALTDSLNGNPCDFFAVNIEIYHAITSIHDFFKKSISAHVVSFLELTFQLLLSYKQHQSSIASSSTVDSDGRVINLDQCASVMLGFIYKVSNDKSVKSLFKISKRTANVSAGQFKQDHELFGRFLKIMIWYCQVSDDQIETWSEDLPEFISQEEETSFTFSLRKVATQTILELVQDYEMVGIKSICLFAQEMLHESNNSWRIREACYLLLGSCAQDILDDSIGVEYFDLSSVFRNFVLEDVKMDSLPMLQGRALCFASQFSSQLPSEIVQQFVSSSIAVISYPKNAIPCVFASKALKNFCEYSKSAVESYSQPMVQGLTNLIMHSCELSVGDPNATADDNGTILFLDTLNYALKLDESVTAAHEHKLTPILLSVWGKFCADVLLTETVNEIFESLCKNPYLVQTNSFHERMLISLNDLLISGLNVVKHEEGEGVTNVVSDSTVVAKLGNCDIHYDSIIGILWTSIDLITMLMKDSPEHSPSFAFIFQNIFPNLIQMLIVTGNNSILQSGQECISVMIQKDLNFVIQCKIGEKNGMEMIILFIAKMLKPEFSEEGNKYIGNLITKLILKAGSSLQPVLTDLLGAVAMKLNVAKIPSFIQSLIMVFAQLFVKEQYDMDVTISFLHGLQLFDPATGAQRNSLEMLLQIWCENHGGFAGDYEMKVSSVALTKLFIRGDPRYNSINVKGDIIIPTNQRILTRSRAKTAPDQYTIIPFPNKCIKLLVDDFIHTLNERVPNDVKGDELTEITESDDDAEEWEDDQIDELKGYSSEFDSFAKFGSENGVDEHDGDPDIQNDPIYHFNMKDYLMDFLKNCARSNINHFMEICEHGLNDNEINIVRKVLSN